MTEEIKEMLHCIEMNCKHNKCFGGVKLDEEDCKLLLNYITNLQQENKELDRMCEIYSKSLYNAELTEYKSRIDKAIEYIDKHTDFVVGMINAQEVKDILEGGDKE